MDLRTHVTVLRRFRWLIAASIGLGTILAAVALLQFNFSGGPYVQFREKVIWSSTSTLYVTQPGFPEGRILAGGEAEPAVSTTGESKGQRFGDAQRFSALAITYSYLLMSDEVRRTIGPLPEGAELLNTAVSEGTGSNKEVLPLISIDGRAKDPAVAQEINRKAIKALTDFVSTRQEKNAIPKRERVQITVITPPARRPWRSRGPTPRASCCGCCVSCSASGSRTCSRTCGGRRRSRRGRTKRTQERLTTPSSTSSTPHSSTHGHWRCPRDRRRPGMSAVSATADTARQPPRWSAALVTVVALAAILLIAVANASPRAAAVGLGLTLCGVVFAAGHRVLLQWRVLLAAVVLVILLVPIRRYSLPGALPIDLEPYRLVVLVVFVGWLGALLIQPDTLFRRTGLEGPFLAFSLAVLASVGSNVHRIGELDVQSEVIKTSTFFASFLLVAYLCASVLHSPVARRYVISVLVSGGTLVAFLAILESRVGYNPFDHLHSAVPLLDFDPTGIPEGTDFRSGRPRAYASAQHSIALGAALAMLLPLALYLARRTRRYHWWACAGLLVMGVLVTVSRTAFLMLVVEVIVLLALKPREIRRMLPLMVVALVGVQFAMPGTLTALKSAFFPKGGLIAEQRGGAGTYGSGRVADLGPGLSEWSKRPVSGQGFGTRITNRDDPRVNAPILDNQWLGLLLELGALGVAAFIWLLVRATRRLGRIARRDNSDDGWLAAALAAAVAAYGVGMFTFDAFSFIQVTFLLFILLGLCAPELRSAFKRYPLVSVSPGSVRAASPAG